jgi:hypothetical protein
MDVQDIRLVVQAMEARPSATPLLLPGTISEVSEDGSTAVLVMDSDPDGITVQARMLFADLGEGDRAMVMFDPPRGVYVVGTIGRRREAGMIATDFDELQLGFELEPNDPTTATFADTTFVAEPNRIYRVDFRFDILSDQPIFTGIYWQANLALEQGSFFGPTQALTFTGSTDIVMNYVQRATFGTVGYIEPIQETISSNVQLEYSADEELDPATCDLYVKILVTDAGPM